MRYLDPKNDLTFKRIFGEHPHLLQSFLNAVLPLPDGREIVSLEYLPAELVPEIPLFKNSIVDVRCIDTGAARRPGIGERSGTSGLDSYRSTSVGSAAGG